MNQERQVIGKCPICGHDVVDNGKAYGCSNWKKSEDKGSGCPFKIWKVIAGRPLSAEEATELLENKSVGPLDGFVSKTGKKFSTRLTLDEELKTKFNFD